MGAPGLDLDVTKGEQRRMEVEERMVDGEVGGGGNNTGWGEKCGIGGH